MVQVQKGTEPQRDQRSDKTLSQLGSGPVWSCCGMQKLSNSSILPIMLPALQSSLRSPPGERTSQIRNVLIWILFWYIIFKTVISIWELFVLILSVSWTLFFLFSQFPQKLPAFLYCSTSESLGPKWIPLICGLRVHGLISKHLVCSSCAFPSYFWAQTASLSSLGTLDWFWNCL